MSDQWITLFDVNKCTGCCNCVLATLDEHVGNEHPGYSGAMQHHGDKLLDMTFHEQGAYPLVDIAYTLRSCQHCDAPACMAKAPDAVTKRGDGIVLIDPVKAKGRRDLVDACPFGAIGWNEETQTPQIWTMDAHLLDAGWKDSRASQACPTGAIETRRMSRAATDAMVARGEAEPLDRDISACPNVLYRNLDRVKTAFVAGTVVRKVDNVTDCVIGANVMLVTADGQPLSEGVTDAFGDFRLACEIEETSAVRIVVTGTDGISVTVDHPLGAKAYAGTIMLD